MNIGMNHNSCMDRLTRLHIDQDDEYEDIRYKPAPKQRLNLDRTIRQANYRKHSRYIHETTL
jgi:hypothetical protein